MAGIRRALALVSAERYIAMAINLGTAIIVARLLAPEEFGVFVLGSSVLSIAEVIRDLGTSNYLVQQNDLTIDKIRTAFTVTLLLTLIIACLLVALASRVESFYGIPGLGRYFYVVTVGFLTGPFVMPGWALFRRDLEFATIFGINVTTMLINAVAAITLAQLGYSYMSLAWASVASGTVGLLLYLFLCSDLSIFRPSVAEWRGVIAFGTYDCGTGLLYRAWEFLPYLIFGRILNSESLGLYQRAVTLCKLPENVLLASVAMVVLPAFAQKKREGHSLKESYLLGLEYVTALLWPSLLIVMLLAHPIVLVLLGKKWLEVVPLVQIIACGSLFAFPLNLSSTTLIAVGAMRHRLNLAIFLATFSICIQTVAAFYGLRAVAAATFVTAPISMIAAIFAVRLHIPFHWVELANALRRSAVVSALSAIGPFIVAVDAGASANVSIGGALLALAVAAVGWFVGLSLTDHPILREIHLGRDFLFRTAIVTNAIDATRRLWQ